MPETAQYQGTEVVPDTTGSKRRTPHVSILLGGGIVRHRNDNDDNDDVKM